MVHLGRTVCGRTIWFDRKFSGVVHSIDAGVGANLVLDYNAVDPQLRYFPQERRGRKSSAVYDDMKRQILVGDLTTDSTITEQSLADQYGCSQSTIREALLTLQEDGLVIRRGYQGTFVTQTTNEEAVILLRLRLNIEIGAIGQIVDNMTAARMAELRTLAAKYETAREQRLIIDLSEADTAFHMTLLRISGMPILEPVLLRTILHLHRFVITRHKHKMVWVDEIAPSHQALLDAIESGDKQKSRDIMTDHLTTNTFELAEDYRTEVVSKVRQRITDRNQDTYARHPG